MDTHANVGLRPEVIAEFPDFWPSGIAVSRSGRIFVSFPRLDAEPANPTLAELRGGTVVPFPDELVNTVDASDPQHRFVSVHGIAMGPGNRLYALDTGARSLAACDPASAKLYVIDLDTNAIVHGIGFPGEVVPASTYLNDLVIDFSRGKNGFAFISDSGANGPNAVIVVDLDSGRSWRRLSGHPGVRPSVPAGFEIATEFGPIAAAPGIDGIALSPDGKTLWWTPLGSYGFFSIPTDALCAPEATDTEIARHLVDHGTREFASDGLDCDREGRVYLTDVTSGTVQRYLPAEHRFERLFQSEPRFRWPDAVRLGPDRIIYVSESQVNRSPQFQGGNDLRERPFRLYRAAIDADPASY
jgi:sugar lactone lactonase YvrE